MSWLAELLDSTKELESPKSFWYWSGLCTISAILKDSVYLPRAGGLLNVYPNIYVMLLAGSALKKGPPIGLSKSIVRQVNNTKLIVGRSSVQAILKELATAHTSPGGKINAKSCGYFVASELSSSLVEDPATFNILTDIYDRNYNPDEWRNLLKSDTFTLKDPTLSILVATNDPHLKDFIKEKDIYGGFFGRMFVIREEKVQRLNPLVDDLENPPVPEKLAQYLKQVSDLKGPFKALKGTAAGKLYHDWYLSFYQTVQDQQVEDKTGTLGRFGDSVLKVAMLLSISDKPELEISLNTMQEAIVVCEKFVEGVRRSTIGRGSDSQFSDQKALIINELLQRDSHSITREALLKKYWMHFNANELDIIIQTFDQAGLITPVNHGGTLIYEMPERIVKNFLDKLRGRA